VASGFDKFSRGGHHALTCEDVFEICSSGFRNFKTGAICEQRQGQPRTPTVIDPSTGLKKAGTRAVLRKHSRNGLFPPEGPFPFSVRFTGKTGELFQKHPGDQQMLGMTELTQSLRPGHGALLELEQRRAGSRGRIEITVEFHTWNSTNKAYQPA